MTLNGFKRVLGFASSRRSEPEPPEVVARQRFLSSVANSSPPALPFEPAEADRIAQETAEAQRIRNEAAAIGELFDEEHYLRHNPDVADVKVDALVHFLTHGWREGRNPNAEFSVEYYLDSNPDVREAELNPFWHYVVAGKAEGRSPMAPHPEPELAAERADPLSPEAEIVRAEFDASFYLRHNPDISAEGVDPLRHFLQSGWHERRDPNSAFSVSYYLDANPDVRDAGINPFWHYLVAGKAEGREPRHPGGYRADALMRARPLEENVRAWRSLQPPQALLSAQSLRDKVLAARGTVAKMLVSIGHDNYRIVAGGVQYCIQTEENAATADGILYLNLQPYQPLPRLAHPSEDRDPPVSLMLDGQPIGAAPISAVVEAMHGLGQRVGTIDVVIHHLLGHAPEQIADLIHAAGTRRCWLWLHDFFTLCPSYVLQRNDVSFCGAPPVASNACTLCLYGPERVSHLGRMASFFDSIDVQVIAPSQFAADFWASRTDLPAASVTVLPHARIARLDQAPRPVRDGPIRVAFLGYPAPHKGWPVFEELVRGLRGEGSDFEFLYFGMSEIALDQVERIPVHVTAEAPDAMVDALAAKEVDFVLHWATCAETFSFSTHEAIASGAAVLTNAGSGNVAATVRHLGLGKVFDDEGELQAFFRDGRARDMTGQLRARRRSQQGVLTRSRMTLDLLTPDHRA